MNWIVVTVGTHRDICAWGIGIGPMINVVIRNQNACRINVHGCGQEQAIVNVTIVSTSDIECANITCAVVEERTVLNGPTIYVVERKSVAEENAVLYQQINRPFRCINNL